MKNFICFSYTRDGAEIVLKIADALSGPGKEIICHCYAMERFCRLAKDKLKPLETTGPNFYRDSFYSADALIFVGAAGIALRKTAPFIRDKTVDPALIVIDDRGRFVIPLLSGHMGGANRLAEELSEILGATPVITTATDNHKKFAVDTWAVENQMSVANPDMIKKISSALLDGETIGYVSDFPVENSPPEQLAEGVDFRRGICISTDEKKKPYEYTLQLVPKCIVAGMGCRKNATFEAVESLLLNTLAEFSVRPAALCAVATIDIKANEPAFTQLSEEYNIPLVTYEAEELMKLGGGFTASRFVREVTGVDNVCERAAVACADGGQLLCDKRSKNGVTLALARKAFTVRW